MGIERKQSAFIDRFVRQAAELGAAESVANLVLEATSHPSLFAFAEILAIPNLSKLLASQYSSYLDVLLLFACGTWKIYQRHAHSLPVLLPDQVRKLKQISVLALIENEKGIVRGKLDQLRRCFKVQFASGRDLTAEHLANTIETSNSWFRTSSNLLHLIEEGIKWVECMNEINNQHKKEINDEIEEVEKAFKDHDGWSEIWDGTDEDCIGRKSRRRRRLEL
ncbi:COP9 signalosome complex subunit 7-like isoform X3 [Zingiber officinale]|uniref:COP9 signalosome complex subunit 7-like isoform X3 n=1 Tax=Zingiber officinale TaxID=94328 RepID=UPI001C4D57BF|nr:COP9 signalosome complex subunit 7-like isoform X3 [Zingiber officinale]